MQKHTLALVLLSALLLTSCDDDDDAPVTPGAPGLVQTGGHAIGIHPAVLSPELVLNPFCPAFPPFFLPFDLTIEGDDRLDISLAEVRLRFRDTAGVQMPQVTLPAPVLTTQYGSTLVRARNRRTFPFDFRFGCGTARGGTLIVIVDTRDEHGRLRTSELKATVQ